MDTCAGLAYERKRLEHLLEQTSNANRRQEILDQLGDIEDRQQNLGCFATTVRTLVNGNFSGFGGGPIAGTLSITNWSGEAVFNFSPITFPDGTTAEQITPAQGKFNPPSTPPGTLDLHFFLRYISISGTDVSTKDTEAYLSTRDTIDTGSIPVTGQPIDPATGDFALVGYDDDGEAIQITGRFL